jgi:hypothetical protein
MTNNKVIVINHFKRPRCSRMCLNHISFCNGVKDYTVISYVEPGHDEVLKTVNDQKYKDSFKEHIIIVNDVVKGGTENQRQSMAHGFELSDYIIFIEDDLLLWRDSLEYHEYCCQRFEKDKDVFNVTLLNNFFENINPYIYMYTIGKRRRLSPAGWGTWRDRFERINELELWTKDKTISMDVHIGQNISGNEIYPKISRIQNIGSHGQFVRNKHWHVFQQFCIIWAKSYEFLVVDKTPWCFPWENDLLLKYSKDDREHENTISKILEKFAPVW